MKKPRRQRVFSRTEIADAVVARLNGVVIAEARRNFVGAQTIGYFVIDRLLPEAMAAAIYVAFPPTGALQERKSLREHKYVTAQMNKYHPQVEEAVFAFHDGRVVAAIDAITGLGDLRADAELYAGGISVMAQSSFLNPHLDNSHDHRREFYRVLNLLYYCSPDWSLDNGGNLELWPDGIKANPIVLPSLFNRLVVMTTGANSWHSVSPITANAARCCVSNYYFSPKPLGECDYARVTSFRGRPEQPIRDLVLRADAVARQLVRKLRPEGVVATKHVYKRSYKSGEE